jgi:tRNA(adenine34) deaminase
VESTGIGAPAWSDTDQHFMRRALALASRSGMREVPVGAVLVSDGEVLGEGWNHPISSHDPTLHAEVDALRQAAARVGNYRLPGSTLYVTLEPCAMCAGALVQARVARLVFGTRDLRFGAVRTKFRLADSDLLNHRAKVEEGLFAAESTALLAQFFAARRKTAGSK